MALKQVDRLDNSICKVLVNGLATQFSVEPKVARKFLPMNVEQWGKLRRLEGGNIMHTYEIFSKHINGQGASFICMHELLSNFFCETNIPLPFPQ